MTTVQNKKSTKQELDLYYTEVGKYPLLSADDEIRLSQLAQKGDQKSRKQMIESNLRLVIRIARAYQGSELNLLDIVQEGNIGLMTAVDKFSPSHGVRFSTYAAWWIRQAISRAISNTARAIRLPYRKEQSLRKITASMAENTKTQEILELIPHLEGTVSLDQVNPITDSSLYDICPAAIEEPGKELEMEELRLGLHKLLVQLESREQEVMNYRYNLIGDKKSTLKDVSTKTGISPETVRQIEIRALKKLSLLGKEYQDYLVSV